MKFPWPPCCPAWQDLLPWQELDNLALVSLMLTWLSREPSGKDSWIKKIIQTLINILKRMQPYWHWVKGVSTLERWYLFIISIYQNDQECSSMNLYRLSFVYIMIIYFLVTMDDNPSKNEIGGLWIADIKHWGFGFCRLIRWYLPVNCGILFFSLNKYSL